MRHSLCMKHDDCLNTIRLLAAINVVWNHSSMHLQLSGIPEWFGKALYFFHGIPIFFILSGFLVWMSVGRSVSFGSYCKKRFWRIYPELWCAVAVEILVLLFLYEGSIDWCELGLFAIGQGTVFPFWVPGCLREYGCGTPNGALWTIFALIQFYLLAFPAYKLLHGKRIGRWLGCIIGLILLSIFFSHVHPHIPGNFGKLLGISFVGTFWMFMFGAFMSEYKDRLLPMLLRWWYVPVVLRVLWLVFSPTDIPAHCYGLVGPILTGVAALSLGYRFPFVNVKTDVSYGIYIYHMTIINAMIAIGLVGGGLIRFGEVVVFSILFAWISTKSVGSFANNMKNRLSKTGN